MNYLEALESELAHAGIPRRRRARILAEFRDHLAENPQAELGAPAALARQFADELGTRLARATAYRAFVALTLAAALLIVMFVTGGRTWGGWGGYGGYRVSGYIPGWWVAILLVCAVAGQVALAAGTLALIRAWRLRHQDVMTAADAQILNRRAAVGLVSGAVTAVLLPVTDLMLARPLIYRLPGGAVEAQLDDGVRFCQCLRPAHGTSPPWSAGRCSSLCCCRCSPTCGKQRGCVLVVRAARVT